MVKIFFSIGNKDIEEILKQGNYEVIDSEDNLAMLCDLLDYVEMDGLVVNRLLDSEDGSQLIRVAKKAKEKEIKVICLVDDFEDYEERKLITILINLGVTAYIKFKDLTAEMICETFEKYPKEFDFDLFAKQKVEYRDIIKSVFKQVIAVYSPVSEGSSRIASHLAVSLARSKNCKVCIVDFNPLKPRFKEIFDMTPNFTLSDALDGVIKQILTPERVEGLTRQCKYQKNLDILFGLYDINDYYTSKVEQYEEIIEKLKFSYDYVVIDTHSWFDVLPTDAALRKADKVVVPVRGRPYSLEELLRYLDMFEKYQDFDIRKFGIVINQYCGTDLTSIEINAKLKYPVLGYISKNNSYQEGNCFKNQKLMNEYVDILKALGIDAKKKGTIVNSVRKLVNFKKTS